MLFSPSFRSALVLLGAISQVTLAGPLCKHPKSSSSTSSSTSARPSLGECAAVNEIVDVLKLFRATPFCSSFLHIPVSTVVATDVATATNYATLTDVITQTSIISAAETIFSTATEFVTQTSATTITSVVADLVTDDVTDVITSYETGFYSTAIVYTTTIIEDFTTTIATYTSFATDEVTRTEFTKTTTVDNIKTVAPGRRVRRDGNDLPGYLAAFASSAVSQACSCLSIPQSVAHETVTRTGTTLRETVSATATAEVSETQTATATIVSTVLETDIVPWTDEALSTFTSSVFTTIITTATLVTSEVSTVLTTSQSTETFPATLHLSQTVTQTSELGAEATDTVTVYCGVPALSSCVGFGIQYGQTVSECWSSCQANSACGSFLYFASADACVTQGPSADSCDYLTTYAEAGPQYAYDRDCPQPQSVP